MLCFPKDISMVQFKNETIGRVSTLLLLFVFEMEFYSVILAS